MMGYLLELVPLRDWYLLGAVKGSEFCFCAIGSNRRSWRPVCIPPPSNRSTERAGELALSRWCSIATPPALVCRFRIAETCREGSAERPSRRTRARELVNSSLSRGMQEVVAGWCGLVRFFDIVGFRFPILLSPAGDRRTGCFYLYQ